MCPYESFLIDMFLISEKNIALSLLLHNHKIFYSQIQKRYSIQIWWGCLGKGGFWLFTIAWPGNMLKIKLLLIIRYFKSHYENLSNLMFIKCFDVYRIDHNSRTLKLCFILRIILSYVIMMRLNSFLGVCSSHHEK